MTRDLACRPGNKARYHAESRMLTVLRLSSDEFQSVRMFYVRCTHTSMRVFEMGGKTQLLTPTMLTYMKPQMESDVAKRDMLQSFLTSRIFL